MQTLSSHELIAAVRDAWSTGRAIIPVIGAGTSVDAGIPPIAELIRYLGAVYATITQGLYLPQSPLHNPDPLVMALRKRYETNTRDFLTHHGWPDRFALQHALYRAAHRQNAPSETLINDALNVISKHLHPWASEQLLALSQAAPLAGTRLTPKDILLDWRPLIRFLTHHHRELADGLFVRLYQGKSPGMSHRYLVYLTKLLGIRALFTFNFDPLIELAFAAERIPHQIFSMEDGRSLPSAGLVTRPAIIKMHGTTHNLLIDERVDYPLSDEYKKRFVDLVGRDPLLFVIGCSGAERRVLDLVDCVAETSVSPTRVLWNYYVLDRAPVFDSRIAPNISCCAFRDASLLLSGIYFGLTSRFPATSTWYPAHTTRLYPSAADTASRDLYPAAGRKEGDFCDRQQAVFIDGTDFLRQPCSIFPALNAYLGSIPIGRQLVYIALEEHHSVGGIISDILSQLRETDSSIMPLLLPVGRAALPLTEAGISIRAAARRVLLGMARQRVAIVFDGLDTFSSRTTIHHGITTASHAKFYELSLFADFLQHVIDELGASSMTAHDSTICITADAVDQTSR